MLSLTPAYSEVHMIQRDDLFNSVVSLYERKSNQLMSEYPFRIMFSGERAIDTGGVSRDMFRPSLRRHMRNSVSPPLAGYSP